MYGRRYDRQEPDQPIKASTINRPIDGLEGLQRAVFRGRLRKQTGPGGIPLVSSEVPFDTIRTAITPSGGIPAMTGTIPGSATCTFYTGRRTGRTLGSETATVLNEFTAVAGNRKIKVNWEDGEWWFLVMACT